MSEKSEFAEDKIAADLEAFALRHEATLEPHDWTMLIDAADTLRTPLAAAAPQADASDLAWQIRMIADGLADDPELADEVEVLREIAGKLSAAGAVHPENVGVNVGTNVGGAVRPADAREPEEDAEDLHCLCNWRSPINGSDVGDYPFELNPECRVPHVEPKRKVLIDAPKQPLIAGPSAQAQTVVVTCPACEYVALADIPAAAPVERQKIAQAFTDGVRWRIENPEALNIQMIDAAVEYSVAVERPKPQGPGKPAKPPYPRDYA